MKNISGDASGWIEPPSVETSPPKTTVPPKEPLEIADELKILSDIHQKLQTKYISHQKKSLGDSLILLQMAIRALNES